MTSHCQPTAAPAPQAACASAVARGYDLVAVQPGSERLFQVACSSLECDLVSLDLSRRLPYRFKPAAVKAALARGLHFEVWGGRREVAAGPAQRGAVRPGWAGMS